MWDPRSRDEIRDTLLADWSARAASAGSPIDTRPGTYHWLLCSTLALVLEAQEAQAAETVRQILPDTASTTNLARHGAVEGVARGAPTAAVVVLEVSGVPLATLTFGAATLTSAAGAVYAPSANPDGSGAAVVLSASGKATAYGRAAVAGTAGNLATFSVLSWSTPPTNANPTATVTAPQVTAVDAELDGPYALRILARRQERPASGNRADWQAWALAVTGVADAVVYPLLHPLFGVNTLGAVTVVPLGPAQGDSPTNTRVAAPALLTVVAGYVEGANNAAGVANAPDAVQRRPVAMRAGDYSIEAALVAPQNVELQVALAASAAAPWAYDATLLVLASPAPTALTLSLAGDRTALLRPGGVPLPVLVNVGTAAYRGGYALATPATVVYNGASGNTDVAFAAALPGAATAATVVLPGLPTWSDVRAKIFAHFDQLGPGDTSPAARWPSEATRLRSRLYRSALSADVVAQYGASGALQAGVSGVLDAVVVTPVADVAPAAKTIVTLGVLAVHV